ncbi:MAG: hypothetical protein LBT68_02605 [Spirochaetales bacterium]|jgi:hypothetical protein|nr:hypothetical protein [Spirochaetales bacterium]
MRKIVSLCIIVTFLPFSLAAQSQTPSAPPPVDTTPAPYEPDEFPGWSRSLRRAEIITLGLFPFVFVFSSLAYDTGRFAVHNFDNRYAPGPFGSADSVSRSGADTRNVIILSISLSALLAAVDFFIEQGKPQKTR